MAPATGLAEDMPDREELRRGKNSVSAAVSQCFAQNNSNPDCTDPEDYFDSVVAPDLDTGKVAFSVGGGDDD
jgi:hypothetical protein